MKIKIKSKIFVDILLLISGLFSAITGIVLLLSPSGAGMNRGLKTGELIFGLSSRGYVKILHNWSSIILVLLVVIHLILNWHTILCYIKSINRNIAKQDKSCSYEN